MMEANRGVSLVCGGHSNSPPKISPLYAVRPEFDDIAKVGGRAMLSDICPPNASSIFKDT
jgi:hypothetical protein